jgi:hypothetical protein
VRYVGRLIRLAFLAPDIVEAIVEGRQEPISPRRVCGDLGTAAMSSIAGLSESQRVTRGRNEGAKCRAGKADQGHSGALRSVAFAIVSPT